MQTNFEVGQTVERLNNRQGDMRPGDIGVIASYCNDGEYRIEGYEAKHHYKNLKLVKKERKVEQYTFNVISESQIDLVEVARILSYKEPLALLELNGVYTAVIDSTVLYKAKFCKGGDALLKRLAQYDNKVELANGDMVLDPIGIRQVKGLIATLKAIKTAPYRKKHAHKGTVTVTLPKI